MNFLITYTNGTYPQSVGFAETLEAAELEMARLASLSWSTSDGRPFDPTKLQIVAEVAERIRPIMGTGSTGGDWFDEEG